MYVYLLVGKQADHAVAVWLGAANEDACFFDPNYGEYWFGIVSDYFANASSAFLVSALTL